MKKSFLWLCGALFLFAGIVPVASAQFSASGNPTQSAIPELSSIVVLCANDSQSSYFRREWGAYVGANNLKGVNLEQTISYVIDEARAQRALKYRVSRGSSEDRDWERSTRKTMNSAARRAHKGDRDKKADENK